MNNITDLVNEARQISGSDYRTAQMLKIASQTVSAWRAKRQFPTNLQVLDMHDLFGLDVKEMIVAIEYSRAYERPLKEAGFITIGMMSVLTLLSLAAVTGIGCNALLAGFAGTGLCILCKITSAIKKAFRAIILSLPIPTPRH